jgi:competence protein ComEA
MEFWSQFTEKHYKILACIFAVILLLLGIWLYPKFFAGGGEQTAEIVLPEEPKSVTVYIVGMIKHPGVYTMSEGSRVQDLLKKAGGVQKGWDPFGINLAKRLSDEDMIIVPARVNANRGGVSSKILMYSSGVKKKVKREREKKIPPQSGIFINEAGESDWEKLPGIGPSMAKKILAYRKEHGAFHSFQDLRNVPGMGEKKFQKIKPYLHL